PRCRPLVWRRRRRRRPTLRPYPTLFRSAVGLPVAAHHAVGCATRLDPPPIEVAPLGDVTEADGVRRLGRGWARRRGAILEVRLRSEEHTSELQSRENLVCRLLLEKKTVT